MAALDDDLTTEAWESRVVPWAGIGAGPAPGSRWIGVSATAVVVEPGGWLPRGDGPEDAGLTVADGSEPLFIGVLGGEEVWAVDAVGHVDEHEPVDLMSLYGRTSERRWAVAGRAVQLVEWARTHRYCGRCGTPTETVPGERARRCPACRLLAFPRLAPAMIVLIERGDEVLLARGIQFPVPMYSCLAGFVEPGESLEEAVAREVREEVGLDVTDVRYQSSQPWPFPHSLMLGFRATWAGGEIEIDPVEIVDAGWYRADDLPTIPPPMSIARRLIDSWLAERG
jgi:NAD+ diphosphatase